MALIIASGCSSNKNDFAVMEETFIIGEGTEYELNGTLTLPKGAVEPYPAVILVHGSGPNDRDETIYNNRPFKDIADYLTSQGIAVLRYDKRTYTHQTKIAAVISELTVKEEVIDDAVSAANLLKNDSRIDSEKMFVLGHSLGGMLAPRIDAEGGNFAGIIILAGSPRSFAEILYDQNMAIVDTLTGDDKILGQSQVDEMMKIFESFKTMSEHDAKKAFLAGASGYYYKEMDAHPAADYLSVITKPVLIMQGDKDFQIYADKDYKEYQTIFGEKSNVTFKLYHGLNHLFMTSTTGTADEYKTANNVDENVLKDISDWILRH